MKSIWSASVIVRYDRRREDQGFPMHNSIWELTTTEYIDSPLNVDSKHNKRTCEFEIGIKNLNGTVATADTDSPWEGNDGV